MRKVQFEINSKVTLNQALAWAIFPHFVWVSPANICFPWWLVKRESLSKDDTEAEDDAQSKMNLYFISEIRDCLDLLGTPMVLQARAKYVMTAFNSN